MHYLHIAKPSLEVPLSIHMMNPEYGTVLSTGEPGKSESNVDKFFRLHFNVYNTVETITCLSKQVNYSTLQGSKFNHVGSNHQLVRLINVVAICKAI